MEKIAVIKKVSLFVGIDAQTIEQLSAIAERRAFKAGQAVFIEGEADATLFIVLSGTIKIDKQVSADQQQTLHQFKTGEFFGEISFVLGGEHRAAAQAVTASELLLIRRTEFDKLAARNPAIAYRIMLQMAKHVAKLLRDMDEKFIELVGYVYGRSKK